MKHEDHLQHAAVRLGKRIANLSPDKRALLYKRIARLERDTGQKSSLSPTRSDDAPASQALAPASIDRRANEDSLPLSFAQQRLWFLDRLLPDKAAYNVPMGWRLQGMLDVAALRRALQLLLTRHEALRTRFNVRGDEPEQLIGSSAELPLPLRDLSGLAAGERGARMAELLHRAAREPFDLAAGPLLRAHLLRLSEDEHALLINVHHIAFDGWSMGVFNRELSAAYAAFAKGSEPQLPALPIQYADYALWQQRRLHSGAMQGELSYWKNKLAALGNLELPADRPRPAVQSFRGARHFLDLPTPLTRSLRLLGRREGATLFMTLLTAFKVLLYRYSSQEDIAVGTPIAARGRAELEELVGFFANTLVLRSDLSGNPRFRELLAQVRETALAAYTHQDLPFEKLVEELAPARDLSRNALFQVMFILQNAPAETLALQDVRVSSIGLEGHTAKFDLTVSIRESSAGLRASWEYAADLFDAGTIERMAENFRVLLDGIAADPGTPIAQLPLLSASERHMLAQWNDTATPCPGIGIHQLFEAQVRRNPEALALIEGDRRLSYGELNVRANRLAHQLSTIGVGPEILVGVCLERSIELVTALLAILKAGGAYLPLDPAYPHERLAFMLEDTQAPVLLTQRALLHRVPRYAGQLLCLDQEPASIAALPDTDPPSDCSANSLAYVIYTSGSTGAPKGVLGLHGSTVNRLHWMWQHFPFEPLEVCCQKTAISFVDSVWEIFGPLLQGCCSVVVSDDTTKDPNALLDLLATHRVTRIVLVPSLLRALLDAGGALAERLPCLKLWITSGEALQTDLCSAFRERMPDTVLLNLYGSSEVAADATWFDTGTAWTAASVPIGRPIANTRIHLLDHFLEPVPIGVAGELYVGGAGLARGYLHREALTRERFLPDPFCSETGARLYRSGDRARYLPDGNIEYLGRMDDQVKIRGFRIEPGEIETVLAEHPAVRQAVVIAWEDVPGDKRLVAYLVAADRASIEIEALRAMLRERLPEYMRPGAYVVLDELPLTTNGKVNRKALPAPTEPAARDACHDTAARDKVERILCTACAETLGLERVGIDDNFFEIGGHSLLAAKLFARLDRVFERTLPLATLFESPTIRDLARFYRDGREPIVRSALVPINAAGCLPPIFAVPGVGGNVLGFADLARELGSEQPFFGLQSIGLDGRRDPLESIEQMAREYLQEVREEQPKGPYYLLGACFGSAVAFEMAGQLLDAGESVAFLGLLDPSLLDAGRVQRRSSRVPAWVDRGLALPRFIARRFLLYRDNMRDLGFKERLEFIVGKTGLLLEALRMRDLFRGNRREFHQSRVTDTNLKAVLRHTHRHLHAAGSTVEIFASQPRFDRMTPAARAAWDALAGTTVVCHRVAGKDSGDAVQGKHAKAFAELLSQSLKRPRERTVREGDGLIDSCDAESERTPAAQTVE